MKKDYNNGITRDLNYKDTLSQCSDKQFVRMMWVTGYTTFINCHNKDCIKPDIKEKVEKLLAENKVGYITDDSEGCYLYCKSKDYKSLCEYLSVEYDVDCDKKEYYYYILFDDILLSFGSGCNIIAKLEANIPPDDDKQHNLLEKRIYDIARHILMNMEKYASYFLNAKPETNEDELNWKDLLWKEANKDLNESLNRDLNKKNFSRIF